MIAQGAIRPGRPARPALQGLYRPATAWEVNVCVRSRFLPCACGIMIARGAIRQNSVGVRPALFCGMNMRKEETNGSLYKFCRSI